MRFNRWWYLFHVLGAEFLRWYARYVSMQDATVSLDVSTWVRSGVGEGSPSSGHRPAASHRSATCRASSQSKRPVVRLRLTLASDPAAMIGHPHRFHDFLRSWNSPEVDHRGCPAAHS